MATVEPQAMTQALGEAIGRILYTAANTVIERKFDTPEGQAELAEHLTQCGWTVTPPKAKAVATAVKRRKGRG